MNWKGFGRQRPWPTELLTWYLRGGTMGNNKNLRQESRCPALNTNREPLEYTRTVLPLCQPVMYTKPLRIYLYKHFARTPSYVINTQDMAIKLQLL
jgi:hypothetical protein